MNHGSHGCFNSWWCTTLWSIMPQGHVPTRITPVSHIISTKSYTCVHVHVHACT